MLYAASEYEEILGYLPRDLAKVLAPLMDKHYVECEVNSLLILPELCRIACCQPVTSLYW